MEVAPGMKICTTCCTDINKKLASVLGDNNQPTTSKGSTADNQTTSRNYVTDMQEELDNSLSIGAAVDSQGSNSLSENSQICKSYITNVLDTLQSAPIELSTKQENTKINYFKCKLDQVTETISKKMKTAYDLGNDLDFSADEIKEKVAYYDIIMNNIKCAIESCDNALKIRLLSIVLNLQKKSVQDTLGITRRTVNTVSELVDRKGIFAIPDPQRGNNVLSDEIKKQVHDFYCDETSGNSKILPGKKDCVSIGNKQHRQKQLFLLNLRELHHDFEKLNPESHVGFSSFC